MVLRLSSQKNARAALVLTVTATCHRIIEFRASAKGIRASRGGDPRDRQTREVASRTLFKRSLSAVTGFASPEQIFRGSEPASAAFP